MARCPSCPDAGGPPSATKLRELAPIDLPQAAGEPLELVALADVVNVNGLARDQEIVFAAGLNVLYGGTGAGKTGYTRVFKRSCRTVDDEQLLGDVYSGDTTPPTAMITISTAAGDLPLAIDLSQPGPPSPNALSSYHAAVGRRHPRNLREAEASATAVGLSQVVRRESDAEADPDSRNQRESGRWDEPTRLAPTRTRCRPQPAQRIAL